MQTAAETKHTPTPWGFPGNIEDEQGFQCVVDEHDLIVCTVVDDGKSDCETQANAEFIVRACNAYDDMLAALELWIAYDKGDEPSGIELMLNYNAALEATKAAIAKAEGR